jgi:hypothetical protein
MKNSFFYYTGLILTISGLIGVISENGPVWSRYFVTGLGIMLLAIAYFRRRIN